MFKKITLYLLAILLPIAFYSCHNGDDEKKKMEDELQRQRAELDSMKKAGVPESLADKFDHVHNSVVMIVAEGDMDQSQGSAVILNEQGDAISNFHVFQDSKRAYAIDADGKKYPVTKIYRFSEEDDYIFFKIGNGNHTFQAATIAKDLPKVGAECFAVGNPRGLEQTLSNGIISAYREDKKLIQNTANITHGSSGGPLFDNKGEVIGITTQGVLEDNLFFAINIEKLPLNNYKNDYNLDIATTNVDDQDDAIYAIKNYLLAEEHRNFNEIYNCFSPTLFRYWDIQNPTRDQLLNRYNHAWTVSENSVNDLKDIKKTGAREYVYTVDFTYFSTKDQMYKTVTDSKVKITFDSDYKIISIYGV